MARNSASYRAGLRPGDVIVAYNGREIDEVGQLTRMVADTKIGTTVTLSVVRNGETLEVEIPIVSASASVRRRQ